MYRHGEGVQPDYEQALAWYRKAADQGWAQAQTELGFMYVTGLGVWQNYKEAFAWYRKAADQGVAAAQHSLGLLYEKGYGVLQDNEEAVAWYGKAAEQGYEESKQRLGGLQKALHPGQAAQGGGSGAVPNEFASFLGIAGLWTSTRGLGRDSRELYQRGASKEFMEEIDRDYMSAPSTLRGPTTRIFTYGTQSSFRVGTGINDVMSQVVGLLA
jgi:TPR repeat protein